ncbi:MAG TPA: VCBS domain-containing protein [Terriglobia bacterium]|nr:VCBS domain-containing protein [Terriglobia bacterium]
MVRKLASVVACSFAVFISANISIMGQDVQVHPDVFNEVNHAVSPPVRAVRTDTFLGSNGRNVVPMRPTTPNEIRNAAPDPVLQTSSGPLVGTTAGNNFDGVSANGYAPPDTNGAVGATQYVQWVNVEFAVYDKSTGALLKGPVAGNTLFANLGGACASSNSGDIIAQYDKLANRWFLSQPVFSNPYAICIAVSQTSDALGAYNLYQFAAPSGNFPDYPKFGIWSDAYYGTFNMFNGNRFLGNAACAFDRNKMLNGATASMQCFNSGYGSLLPSDVDGTTAPPAGEPAFFVNFGSNSLNFWKFHVDFVNSNNSTFTGPTNVAVAAFSPACGGGTCIPQAGTSQTLDSLADRLMYRFAYRNFGDHESLVVNHSVTAGSSVGVRWYEIRTPNSTPTIFQQGTFAPDSKYRWMGSIAMDHSGDIAVGYSESSSSINPAIFYTGRVPSDASGTMESENLIYAGPGSQSGGNLSRWGDYSSMSVDPTDDCTFWYTNEYLPYTGSFNWNTRIASFKFPTCGQPPKPDFSIGASPTSQSVVQGGNAGYTVTVSSINSYSGTVTLSTGTLPAGVTSSFNPDPVTGPSFPTSTLTLFVATGTTPGSYPVTISGTDGTLTHTTQVTLVVTSTGDFSISASSPTLTVTRGSSANDTITVTSSDGFTGNVAFSVSGLPAHASASFSPASVAGHGSSTLTVKTVKPTPTGTSILTITGTSGSLSHSVQVTLKVQ